MGTRHRVVVSAVWLCLLACVGASIHANTTADGFPVLKGSYLGQKAPGMMPEVFAPGIISTKQSELNAVFSPRGDEFYYAIHLPRPEDRYVIMFSRQVNGTWTRPEVAPFSGQYTDVDMNFSLDGQHLFFCSKRPVPQDPSPEYNIWVTHRLQNPGWSEPENLGLPVNTTGSETYPSFTKNGRMYFSSSRRGGNGSKDIYSTEIAEGQFSEPVNLGAAINSQYGEGDTFVAPDESYMIVSCWGSPKGEGLYVSFKETDGSWTRLVDMESILKRDIVGGCPMVSPDGRYLFYTNKGQIYWVDARIIRLCRPQ
jgi:hypothetical protein